MIDLFTTGQYIEFVTVDGEETKGKIVDKGEDCIEIENGDEEPTFYAFNNIVWMRKSNSVICQKNYP